MQFIAQSLNDMDHLAQVISSALGAGDHVFLHGPLGAGKSSWTRFLLAHRGYSGHVLSPTYAIVQSYADLSPAIHHFDLYRLSNVEELDAIGFSEYYANDTICVVEWPDLLVADGVEPALSVYLSFSEHLEARTVEIKGCARLLSSIQSGLAL